MKSEPPGQTQAPAASAMEKQHQEIDDSVLEPGQPVDRPLWAALEDVHLLVEVLEVLP
jgi:hypothetical protein